MAAVAPPRMSAQRRREARAGYFFILPWILSLLVFTAYPVIASFYLSFTDYTILEPPRWVGLTNFRTMSSIDPSARNRMNSRVCSFTAICGRITST